LGHFPLKQQAAASRKTVKGGAAKKQQKHRLYTLDGFSAVLIL